MARGDASRCIPDSARMDNLQEQITNITIGSGSSVDGYDENVLVQAAINKIDVVSSIAALTPDGTGGVVLTITGTAGSQNLYETIDVGGTALVADSPTDTLSVTAGANIALSANAGADSFSIAVTGIASYTQFTVSAVNGGSASGGTASTALLNQSMDIIADTGITLVRSGNSITIGAPGGGASLSEGEGINISGDEVSVQIAELTAGVNRGLWFFDSADPPSGQGVAVFLQEDYEGGIEFSEDGDAWDGAIRDRNRFHLVKGNATSSVTPGSPEVDGIVRVHGEDPTDGDSGAVITPIGLPVFVDSGDQLYLKFDDQGSRSTPILESWSTDTIENIRPILAGFSGYSPGEDIVLGHLANETEAGQQKVQWLPAPQKVIWGIDPDGGHTITTSGTTLTLTLKVTKYTFGAVNFVSAVDEDVVVTYTGTSCS